MAKGGEPASGQIRFQASPPSSSEALQSMGWGMCCSWPTRCDCRNTRLVETLKPSGSSAPISVSGRFTVRTCSRS